MTYEEWRVTGIWLDRPYERIFSPKPQHRGRRFVRGFADPEAAAHEFASSAVGWAGGWSDGPHLQKRIITVTEWEAA